MSQRRYTVISPPRGMIISPALPHETQVSMLEPRKVYGWTGLHLEPLGDAGDGRRILRTACFPGWLVVSFWLVNLCIISCGCSSLLRPMALLERLSGFFGYHLFPFPLGSFVKGPDSALDPCVFGRSLLWILFWSFVFNFFFVGDHNTWPSLSLSQLSLMTFCDTVPESFIQVCQSRPRLALNMSACYFYGYWFHRSKMEYFLYRHRRSLSRHQSLLMPFEYAKSASKQLLGKWRKSLICTNWELFSL